MEQWLSNTLLPTVLAAAVMLLVLWPTERSGARLLRTWGIPSPRPDQVAEAVRYLWHRRILYVVFFLAVPPLAGPILRDHADLPGVRTLVPLFAAMLVAELVATLRPVSGVRVASLDPRGWRDLVPRWAVVAVVVLVVVAVVWSVAGLVAQPWANRYAAALSAYESAPPPGVQVDFDDDNLAELTTAGGWFVLGYTAAALVLMVLLVRLAVRRPAVADEAVDAALRTRTARVAVGIGFGWLGSAVFLSPKRVADLRTEADWPVVPDVPPPEWLVPGLNRVGELVGFFGLLVAIGCWIWVANPTRRSLATTRVAETDG